MCRIRFECCVASALVLPPSLDTRFLIPYARELPVTGSHSRTQPCILFLEDAHVPLPRTAEPLRKTTISGRRRRGEFSSADLWCPLCLPSCKVRGAGRGLPAPGAAVVFGACGSSELFHCALRGPRLCFIIVLTWDWIYSPATTLTWRLS